MVQPEAIRIVIADDHPLFRKGLKSLLNAEPGFMVVGEAENGDEAVRVSRSLQPDILLLDLAMPGASGLDALGELATAPSSVKTIVLTAAIAKPEIVKALQLGAAGVVAQELGPGAAVQECPAPSWTDSTGSVANPSPTWCRPCAATPRPPRRRSERASASTARELDITSAVVSGLSNKESRRSSS
jgi:DNA-binding NarL/FixJ family response regulator